MSDQRFHRDNRFDAVQRERERQSQHHRSTLTLNGKRPEKPRHEPRPPKAKTPKPRTLDAHETILDEAKTSGRLLKVWTVDGTESIERDFEDFTAKVLDFDKYAVVFELRDGAKRVVFKHAIRAFELAAE
jgi:sRNA-binding regulator protein Hfq